MFPYSTTGGYAALGLAANPFVAEAAPGVPDLLWTDRPGLPPPPDPGSRRLVQVMGPKGAGKTSLLLRWRSIRPGPYHYVARGRARWFIPPVAPLAYWDEADRLREPIRTAQLTHAAARGATIVAGTHRDLATVARRCGLRVTTYEFPTLNADLLRQWARLRIADAALPGHDPSLRLDDATAAAICSEVGASLRDAAVALHIWAAGMAGTMQQN